MSFIDVRDLTEQLKLLGYPNKFPLSVLYTRYGSLNCFRIVADILKWLAGRFEPDVTLAGGTTSENERILFIRSATEFFAIKAGIRLNPKKLYVSASITAKELQKITKLLLSSTDGVNDDPTEESYQSLAAIDLGDKIEDLRRARELSSQLTNSGATLYDLLTKEETNKEIRITQSTRPLDIATVERLINNAISATEAKLEAANAQLESSRIERNSLASKLQRKTAELERSKQRLEALQKIRPAYQEEFEENEKVLEELFEQYFVRITSRDYLKSQIKLRTKPVTPMATPNVKPSENSLTLLPEGLIDDDDEDGDGEDIEDVYDDIDEEHINGLSNEELLVRNQEHGIERRDTGRVRPTTGRLKPRTGTTVGRHKLIGSMLGNPEDDALNSSLGSDESGSEIDLAGNEFPLNSDDDLSISKLRVNTSSSKPQTKNDQSDEDF